uniref:CLIP domain-containing serine protease n=1 Tax=Anopheles atroparvus TaxID=41427 RepID=A0AAG5CQ92_ANOAO
MEPSIVLPALVVLVVWLGQECAVNGQESCRTPDRRDGICTPLRQCASIQERYFESDRWLTQDEVDFLKELQCKTKDVTVCCADGVTTTDRNLTSARGTLPDPKKFECGLDSLADRIVGGNDTAIDEFPWYALLQYQTKKGTLEFKCGGSLINARYVLTAAHCLAHKKVAEGGTLVGVRLGEHNTATEQDCTSPETMEECADPPQNFGIEQQIVHPGYDKIYQYNDIALIRLDRDAEINNYVQPVCLPVEDFTPTAPNAKVTVVGFGHTGRQRQSGVKQKAKIPIFPRDECEKKWEKVQLTEQQLCAGGVLGVDSCSGDSGGPMLTQRLNWVQEGVISFGNKCALEGWPGIYTRVSSYIDWIKDNIRP